MEFISKVHKLLKASNLLMKMSSSIDNATL